MRSQEVFLFERLILKPKGLKDLLEILPRSIRQDEESGISPTPQILYRWKPFGATKKVANRNITLIFQNI